MPRDETQRSQGRTDTISQSTRYIRRTQPRRGGGGILALLFLAALFAAVQMAYWRMGVTVLGILSSGLGQASMAVMDTLGRAVGGFMRGLLPL